MKRITILFFACLMTMTVKAQQIKDNNYVGLNLGGGINSMSYSPMNGDYGLGLGFDAGLHFTHFFGQHFGFGFGIHYNYATSHSVYNFDETTPGLTHPDNPAAQYDLVTIFEDWRESQRVGMLSVPIEFFWRAPIDEKWFFVAGLGASIDLPIHGKVVANEGSYTTTGYYPSLGYAVEDLPSHGFSTYDADLKEDVDNVKMGVSAIADLGFRKSLKNNWGLYLGIYGGYGVTSMLEEQKTASLLEIDAANPTQHTYNGTFESSQVESVRPLRFGVKIGIDLGWMGRDRKAEARAAEEAALRARQQAIADSIAAAEKLAAAQAAAEKAAREKAEAEARAAREKAEAEARAAAERERAARERAALQARLDSIAEALANLPARPVDRQEMQKKLDDINATVYFETSGTTPKFDKKTDDIIRTLCASMMADNNLKAEITGHTDNTGTPQINMKYGKKRAEALKKYMISLGAPAANILIESRGQEDPIAPNDSDENRAKNRRATVILK